MINNRGGNNKIFSVKVSFKRWAIKYINNELQKYLYKKLELKNE